MRRLSSSSSAAGFHLLAGFAFLAAAASLSAQQGPESIGSISREVKDVFQRCSGAVVKIHAVDPHGELCGTGFFVDPTGTLYTAYSVGGEGENFTVEFKGKKVAARQLVADIRSGLAILKIDSATPTLPIGKSEELEVATPVVSIGYPLDLRETPNFGMIAGFDRKYLGNYFPTILLRANLPTQRGEAGAPLLNFKGEVVGIVVSSLENNSSCYAVPIEAAEKIRNDFVRFGEVRPGWVGIDVAEAAEPTAGSRAQLTNILPDTPAADSGAKPGDILLQVGNKPIRQPEDVIDASFFITAGDVIPITVMRGDQKLTFNVQADFHPAGRSAPLLAAPGLNNRAIPLNLQPVPQRAP
jgi:S1-C subfamily serine protease